MGLRPLLYVAAVLLAISETRGIADWTWSDETFLDRYVNTIDPEFDPNPEFIRQDNNSDLGCQTYVVRFTSGRYLNDTQSSQPLWWHYMFINIPEVVLFDDAGYLFIEAGRNGGPPSADDDFALALCDLAKNTGTVTAVLKQIPNQPITFYDDPWLEERIEGDLTSYTWRRFIETHEDVADFTEADFGQIAEFPMARAGVRALDVISSYAKTQVPGSDITRFGVAGASKRGWAAWLVAATDRRVELVAPLVISILNFTQNMHHHYENLGAWTVALSDYWLHNITVYLDDPRTQLLLDQVDPYSYRKRFTMLKMVGAATGDEFFSPDATYDFWNELPEPKYLLMADNAEHTLFGSYFRFLNALAGMWYGHLTGFSFPQLSWSLEYDDRGGLIHLTTDKTPARVSAFHGDSDSGDGVRRDFRAIALDGIQWVYWNETEDADWIIYNNVSNTYIVHYDVSEDTPYRGFMINTIFDGPLPYMPLDFTTEVNIIPQERPFPPCVGTECAGGLI